MALWRLVGAASWLALTAGVTIAADDASLVNPKFVMGRTPTLFGWRSPGLRTLRYSLPDLSCAEALRIGLVNQVVPKETDECFARRRVLMPRNREITWPSPRAEWNDGPPEGVDLNAELAAMARLTKRESLTNIRRLQKKGGVEAFLEARDKPPTRAIGPKAKDSEFGMMMQS
jgi:enoyl-CoA hydratase/carnithine racemase